MSCYFPYMFAVICRRPENAASVDVSFLSEYLYEAKKYLHKEMSCFYENVKIISGLYLTNEERRAVERAQLWRNKELLGYYKVIRCLEGYVKKRKHTFFVRACYFYKESEAAWKEFFHQMSGFVMVSLMGRREIKF